MDEWLDDIGLYRKNTALDGTCLFRAVAEQVLPANPVNGHLVLRKQVCEFMRKHREIYIDRVCVDYDEYLAGLELPKGWGSPLELDAISHIYRVEFLVFYGPEKPVRVTGGLYDKELMLCVTGDSFYDAVYTKAYVEDLGFCQSIVYKWLYEEIFKLADLDYAVNKMLHDKAARAQRERYLSLQAVGRDCATFESYVEDGDSTVNVRNILDSGAILFPYKVAKALDPDIFRNIAFDNWVESQRVTRRNNYWYGNGGPLRVGVKCHVRYEGQTLTAYIQELTPDRGPAVVYIEELSQKKTVLYDDLIALPRSSLKPEWSYSHKHQMISKFGHKVDNSPCRGNRRPTRDGSDSQDEMRQPDDLESGQMLSPMPMTPKHTLIYTHIKDSWAVVDKMAGCSNCPDGSDLPFHDIQTLRFFYNMGIEYFEKGIYVPKPIKPAEEQNMAELCHGMPLIQPAPPTHQPPHPMVMEPMASPIMVMPPLPPLAPQTPVSPILPPMTGPPPIPRPPPGHAPIPELLTPPLTPEQPNKIHETPVARERSRGSKFVKPPRFQRLESAKSERCAAPQEEPQGEVQIQEISSTSSPQELCEPMAMLAPFQNYPPPQPQPLPPYMYPPTIIDTSEPHMEGPYMEQPQYTEFPVRHVLESPQPVYYEPEGPYRPCYPCYSYPSPVTYYY